MQKTYNVIEECVERFKYHPDEPVAPVDCIS